VEKLWPVFTCRGNRRSTAWKTGAWGSNGAFPRWKIELEHPFRTKIDVLGEARRFNFVIFVRISSFSSISLGICANPFFM